MNFFITAPNMKLFIFFSGSLRLLKPIDKLCMRKMSPAFYTTGYIIPRYCTKQKPNGLQLCKNSCLYTPLKLYSTDVPKCWKCGKVLTETNTEDNAANKFFCQKKECGALQPPLDSSYFGVFGLPEKFDIDSKMLTKVFRQIQNRLHPDKLSNLSEEEREHADGQSAMVNKAYDVLLKPVERAEYMLKLRGRSLEESDIQLSSEFLMEMMELNEDIADAKDPDTMTTLFETNRVKINETVKKIQEAFDGNDIDKARYFVAQIKYLMNIENKLKEKSFLF